MTTHQTPSPAPQRDRSADLALIGTTIAAKYRVIELLGQGGFGSVFLVEIVAGMVGEKLALKLIPADLAGDEKIKAQFLNEIRVAMRMVNKYIVQIRDVGETAEGQLYYTMDYCPGETLGAIVKRDGAIDPARCLSMALRILDALKTAHAAGVVHRDLKPANVMVFQQADRETVRVLDFGIATAITAARTTKKGFVGSPHYMPPEQFLNEPLGFFTDTYAVGVILYECIAGKRPYQGRSAQEVYNDLKSRPATPLEEAAPDAADAWPGLSDVVEKALERNPELRYQTSKDLFTDLKSVLDGSWASAHPEPAASKAVRRRSSTRLRAGSRASSSGNLIAGIVVGALLIGGGIVFVLNNPPEAAPVANNGTPTRPGTPVVPGPANGANPGDATDLTDPDGSDAQRKQVIADRQAAQKKRLVEMAQAKEKEEAAKKAAIEKARSRLEEAIAAAKAEQWDKVREACFNIVGIDPSLVEAFRLKGQAEVKLGLGTEALSSLGEVQRRAAPGTPDAALQVLMMEANQLQPMPDAALEGSLIQAALAALKQNPKQRDPTLALLLRLEKRQDRKSLVGLLAQAQANGIADPVVERLHQKYVVDLPKEEEAKAQDLLQQSRKAMVAKEWQSAASKATEGYALKPLPDLGLVLAEAHLRSDQAKASLTVLQDVARHVGGGADAVARMGILYARNHIALYEQEGRKTREHLDRARQNLEVVLEVAKAPGLKLQSFTAAAHTYSARLAAHEPNLQKVEDASKKARDAQDRDSELIYHQAESYFLCGEALKGPDRDAAFQRTVLRLTWYQEFPENKKDGRAWYLMGMAYLRMGGKRENFSLAIDRFAKAQQFGMKNRPEVFDAKAEAYLGLNDPVKAGQEYRNSFEAVKSVTTCVKSARCFLDGNLKSSAEDILRQGLKAFPRTAEIEKLLNSLRG